MADMTEARRGPTVRVLGLVAVMLAAAVPLHLVAVGLEVPESVLNVPLWMLALGFLVAELLRVPLHVRGNAHAVSLSEIPLLVGAVAVAPSLVVASRLGAAALAQVVHRSSPIRLVFNLSLFYL
jgi:hypothetical protein